MSDDVPLADERVDGVMPDGTSWHAVWFKANGSLTEPSLLASTTEGAKVVPAGRWIVYIGDDANPAIFESPPAPMIGESVADVRAAIEAFIAESEKGGGGK